MSWLDDIIAKVVRVNGAETVGRRALNLVAGPNVSLQATDDEAGGQTTVRISAGTGLGGVVSVDYPGLAPVIPEFAAVGDQLYWDGAAATWGNPQRLQTMMLGARAPHMTGWELDATDGCYVQSSAAVAGELVLPLSLSNARTITSFTLFVIRVTGSGTLPTVMPTVTLESRVTGAGPGGPAAWAAVPSTLVNSGTPSWPRRALVLTPTTPVVASGSHSYRLRLTGEAGTYAERLKLLDIAAVVS